MSTLTSVSTRAVVATQNRLALRGEHGQSISEYAIVVLLVVGIGLAIAKIAMGGAFNGVISDLLKHVLQTAIGQIH